MENTETKEPTMGPENEFGTQLSKFLKEPTMGPENEFDTRLSKFLNDSMDAGDAIPSDNGAQMLMVTITLKEYRSLVERAAKGDAALSDMWRLRGELDRLHAEVDVSRKERDRLAALKENTEDNT